MLNHLKDRQLGLLLAYGKQQVYVYLQALDEPTAVK